MVYGIVFFLVAMGYVFYEMYYKRPVIKQPKMRHEDVLAARLERKKEGGVSKAR